MKSGVLNVYKEKGLTSHDVVAKIRRLYGTKKVGHTGTLDPQATGVLTVLVGGAAKACDRIPEETKIYRATVRFGIATDTEDVWGKIVKEDACRPDRASIEHAMASFLGEYMQTPPMVSALKVNGKKLYEYAREGITVERRPRPVFVHSFTLLSFSSEEAEFRAEVSKGTYIRTLLTDLCARAGVLGAMSFLEREKNGMFTLSDACSIADLEREDIDERQSRLIPTERLFSSYPIFSLPSFFDGLIANGCAVLTEKLSLSAPVGSRFRLYRDGAFFALGEVIEEDGAQKLKKIKSFPPDGE